MDKELMLTIYRPMVMARRLDLLAEAIAQRGEAPFYVPCTGHEGLAALAPLLTPADWLHCHYRDLALVLARGEKFEKTIASFLGKPSAPSAGRRMPGFPGNRALQILSSPTVVGNNALQAVGVAMAVKADPARPIVYCALGDGGTQEGEVLEAIAEAVRSCLPVLFMVEDNQYALSTPTAGRTWYDLPAGPAAEFYGLPILRVSGSDPVALHTAMAPVIAAMRADRGPRLVVARVERLGSHTNADDHRVYRPAEDIARIQAADPLALLAGHLRAAGVAQATLDAIDTEAAARVDAAYKAIRDEAEPTPVFTAKKPLPDQLQAGAAEYRGHEAGRDLSMLEALRETLRLHLQRDPRVSLYGEDIEDPKGDVFGLTRGLGRQCPAQVRNSPLSENTILGAAIGRALAGERPVALIQFADFLPVVYNQIISELGSMHWRTLGDWNCPVIVMSICGAYRPGLGPFHAQTPTAVMAHVPGVDVLMPATAADAAGLLNAAFESGRPTIFLYPKSLLNDRRFTTSADLDRHLVPIGKARVCRAGADLTLVGCGSTVPLCEQAADELARVGASAEVLDLRSISPWDQAAVLGSARKTGRLLVVHEDNHTCGIGAEILATVAEALGGAVKLARLAQADTYLPYHFANQLAVLPSFKTILEKAAALLDLDLSWQPPPRVEAGLVVVPAIGSSPSDETLRITELHVAAGETVAEGQLLVSVEADKAAMDISAPVAGTLVELLIAEGDVVTVGAPIVKIKAAAAGARLSGAPTDPGRPVLERRAPQPVHPAAIAVTAPASGGSVPVYISSVCATVGSRLVENKDLLRGFPQWDSSYVRQRTGVEKRYWIGENESVLTLAVKACRDLLAREQLTVGQVDAIICSTGTPLSATPSLACRVLTELTPPGTEVLTQAHDINAACTGYLYALQNGYDMLQAGRYRRVLVITAETLSRVLNHLDLNTLFLFGDAATATLLTLDQPTGNVHLVLRRPLLAAKACDEKILYVPFMKTSEHMEMAGQPVFKMAVKMMTYMMDLACETAGIKIEDLAMIVPHQANERIIEAIRKSINRNITFPNEKMFNHIREYGNTSSNSIPLALTVLLPHTKAGDKVGLCAFGGGFTFGAAVIEIL